MQIETPPEHCGSSKRMGERRGLVLVHTGDGKGKSRRLSAWHCAPMAAANRSRSISS